MTERAEIDENFLVARVSKDGRVIGIEHPTNADWNDVLRAHFALNLRIAERLAAQNKCPKRTRRND